MGSADKRRTQLDMHALAAAAKPSPPPMGSSGLGRLQSPIETLHKNVSSKKRARSPEGGVSNAKIETDKITSRLDAPPVTKPLRLRTAWESPWKRYQKIYDRELAGSVEVAVRKESPIEIVHVRKLQKPGAEKALQMFRSFQHSNIVLALDAFTTDDGLYIVLEPMSISLEDIVSSPAYPDEGQLAAILGQVLNGLAYLMAEGFEHGCLCCSNILLKPDGTVKIANLECCDAVGQSRGTNRGLTALPSITMELMQKYVKEDGAIGIDDL